MRRKELSVFLDVTWTALVELLCLHRREPGFVSCSLPHWNELTGFGLVEAQDSAPVVTKLGQKVVELCSPENIMEDLVRSAQDVLHSWKADARAHGPDLYDRLRTLQKKKSCRYLGYEIWIVLVELDLGQERKDMWGPYRVPYTKMLDGYVYSGHVCVQCLLRRSGPQPSPLKCTVSKKSEKLPPKPPPSKGSARVLVSREYLEKEAYRSRLHGLSGAQAKSVWVSTIEIDHKKARTGGGE